MTQPEYILSFELKYLELALSEKNASDFNEFQKILDYQDRFCRDILDESDEILNVKYQLIYTVGLQKDLDKGFFRWSIISNLIMIVQEIAKSMFGDGK